MSAFTARLLAAYPAPTFAEKDVPPPLLALTMAGEYQQLAHHNMQQRVIPEYVLLLCTAGDGWVRLDRDPPRPVRAGQAVFQPAGQPHRCGCRPQGARSQLWLHCTGDTADFFYRRLCESAGGRLPILPEGADSRFLLQSVVDIFRELPGPVELLRAESLAVQLLCGLCSETTGGEANRRLVAAAMGWMESCGSYDLSLDQLAERFGVSKYHFIRLFRRYAGVTPMQYFQQLRLQKACRLLSARQLTVAQIADQLGYSSPYHFSRSFKQHYGISPGRFQSRL